MGVFDAIRNAVRRAAERDVFAYLFFAGSMAVLLWSMIQSGEGLVYPLDDTYIHVALSQNLARHGVWGVVADRAAYCSSSPLWTLLLAAAYGIAGVWRLTPLVLATLFAFLTLWIFCGQLRRKSESPLVRTILSCLFCALVPLPAVAALGMEHAMHVFFAVAFVIRLERHLSGPQAAGTDVPLLLYAMAAAATRFESMFLIVPASLLLLLRREIVLGVGLVAFGMAPIAVYGVWALASGGFFLPNSLMFKGQFMSALQLLKRTVFIHLYTNGHCSFVYVMIAGSLALAGIRGIPAAASRILAMLAIAVAGHFTFAAVGSVGRYEAYLVAALAAVALPLSDRIRIRMKPPEWRRTMKTALLLFLTVPFLLRAAMVARQVVHGSRDIFCQQLQLVRLFRLIPPESRGLIAINDIGCFACATDLATMDLWGLGDQEVASLRHRLGDEKLFREELRPLLRERGVKYAALFDSWYPRDSTPRDLIFVGRLNHPGNEICAEPGVSLYASDEEHADALRLALASIEDSLPSGVVIENPSGVSH